MGLFKSGKASVITGFEGMLDKTYTSAQDNLNKGVKEIIAKLNDNIALINNLIDITNDHTRAIITIYELNIEMARRIIPDGDVPKPRTDMSLQDDSLPTKEEDDEEKEEVL